MDAFHYRDHQLWVEDVALSDIAARYGTPAYVYSRTAVEEQWRAFDRAFAPLPRLICYAVKANSNLAILRTLARLESGFDIVSVGELERVLRAGGDPNKIVFAGVGKGEEEICRALEIGIRCFNVEHVPELERINRLAAARRVKAPVALRVNPDVDARTHPYIATGLKESKFGIPAVDALSVCRHAAGLPNVEFIGVGFHIGSQLTDVGPFEDAVSQLLILVEQLAAEGLSVRHVDIGGGLGIRYRDERPPGVDVYGPAIRSRLTGRVPEVILEPGRAIVGNAGVLLTRVEYVKVTAQRRFAIVDAAMNDLLRPALYDAWHDLRPVFRREDVAAEVLDVVGPVCESGDFLARERRLSLRAGDLIAIMAAGAYGFAMSSNYNSRPRPAEILVQGQSARLVRQRENVAGLMAGESIGEE